MKQQILIIHGGTTFNNYKEYFSYLKNKKIDLKKLRHRNKWTETLSEKLGKKFEVFLPKMPNPANARYKEWRIWFEKIIDLLNSDLILIGHSLGGIFLAKYLSENIISKKIKATILIAAPFDDANSEESLTDFVLPSSLSKFSAQGGKIYLLQSKDDKVVPFNQVKKYKKALPKAITKIFTNREHFNQKTFPEIIKLIKFINIC